jgi:hypothetical protein
VIRHQLVQWILLPNGLTADGQLSASVFVAPRLRPSEPATLTDFPDFADWRSILNELELVLERADGATEAPMSMFVSASGELWQALFPPATTVRAFAFDDLADRPLISYPVNEVLGHLRERWTSLAFQAEDDLPITNRNASPIGLPPTPGELEGRAILSDHFTELRDAGRRGIFEGVNNGAELSARVRNQLDAAAAQARALRLAHSPPPHELIRPFGSGGTPAEALYALAGFHTRPSHEQPRDFPADRQQARTEFEEALDFHHHLSTLGDHPALLRSLGLVIDLEIRPDFIPTSNDTDPPTLLRLRVQRPSAFAPRSDDPDADTWNTDVTPWTSCRLTNIDGQAFFSAAERTARLDFAHGFLRMDPARYAPITVDVDGLALKALSMAATLQNQEQQEQRPLEEPVRDGVPAARTGGVALVHTDHAQELHEDFEQARANNNALEQDPDNPPILAAEDLLRGYRVDIWSDGSWRSLHRRHIDYAPERNPAEALASDDEGSIQLSLTAETDRPGAPADPDRPLYAHEAMTTWDGWSLSLPRPGAAIPHEPTAPEASTDLGAMRLAIAASALPNSLPRLRFRSDYRVRARTVDLAGNSHALPVADQLLAVLEGTGQPRYLAAAPAKPLRYRRFEPVPPPELVPRLPFGPGESIERLVIRSTPDQSAADYATASQAASEPFLRFQAFCDRHVAASKASLQLVETHGMLDEAIDSLSGLDLAAATAAAQPFYELAARESGSFHENPAALFVPTGNHDNIPQGYVCIDADSVELPYLPDPLSVGAKARIALEPDRPEQTLDIRFDDGGGWERPLPFRLRLQEGNYTADYSDETRLLTIGLPRGRTARLRLSSLFEDDPDIFGILDWCRQELDPASAEQVYDAIKLGTHWMTAPWREIVLVHAVQKPLLAAELELDLVETPGFTGRRTLARPRGATGADLSGRLFFDPPSTAQLDLSANWDEVEDNPDRAYQSQEEMVRPARRDVFTLAVPEPFGTPWVPEVAPFIEPLKDEVVGFRTRGQETETPEQQRLNLLAAAAVAGLNAPEQRRLEAGAAQLEKLRAHEFGDTKYRRVTYQSTAATRFREYYDPAMPATDGTSTGQSLSVEILSSAPPAKPEILQVLPLMRYTQTQGAGGGATTSKRESMGLRVWLARPWWSSGTGELLAVVCDRGGPLSPESELSREITVIVQDPAHASTIPQPLLARSFLNTELIRENVPLFGAQSTRDIAAYRPTWDSHRQAWYCDIAFPTGVAYFPFVRLGLARYQPSSIPNYELSPIVPTAFVQTVPDRTVTCTLTPDGTAELSLSGPAPSSSMDTQGTAVAGTNVVVALVETHNPAIADPLLGWTATGLETQLAGLLNGDGTATWSGTVEPPDPQGRKLRLAVREYEIHPADDRVAQTAPGFAATRRLVHADVIPL